MQLTSSITGLAVLTGLATTAHASPHHVKRTSAHSPELRKYATPESAFDASTATLDDFASQALSVAKAQIANSTSGCTQENLRVRKLWENLAGDERIEYTNALKCLMEQPAKTPSSLAPGAKTRYDDYIVTHINQTLTIHMTANFLGWHRWFIYEMEEDLRNVCNYTGALPYWDWSRTAKEGMANSEVFDGSATSLSGDGLPLNYSDSDVIILNANTTSQVVLPPGTGGGCLASGPFANMTVNLGPDSLPTLNGATDSSAYAYDYNPRCVKRSLTDVSLERYANETSVLTLLRDTDDIWTFETLMQGPEGVPELGVHGGGHFSLGGDPGRDVYTSPGDPAFWSHHANIDRVWWMWQMLDPATRAADVATAVNGPLTFANETAPYGNGTTASVQQLGYVAEGSEYALGELMSTTGGMFCYVYE